MHQGVHLLFSILTLGLWSVSWLSIYLAQLFRPWRCEHCRWHKPEFRGEGPEDDGPKPEAEAMSGGGGA
jgi:hypothetical protein